jgi:hypothetical protein
LNEGLNKANLFYTSERGKQLQNEGTQTLREQSQASQALQGQLGEYSQQLLGARQDAQGAVNQGEQDAYQRQLENSLRYGGIAKPAHRPPRHRMRRGR